MGDAASAVVDRRAAARPGQGRHRPPRRRCRRLAAARGVPAAVHGERAAVRGHRADGRAREGAPWTGGGRIDQCGVAPHRPRTRRAERGRSCRRRRGTGPRARSPAVARRTVAGPVGRSRHRSAPRGQQHSRADRHPPLRHRDRTAGSHARSRRHHRERGTTRARLARTPAGRRPHRTGSLHAGALLRAGPGRHARGAVRRDCRWQRGCRPLRGPGGQGARALTHGRRSDRGRSRRRAGAPTRRECATGERAQRARDCGRRPRCGDRPRGRGAHGRALHRDGHLPPASGRALAPQGVRRRRDGGRAATAGAERGAAREAGRVAGVFHLLARTGGKRRASRGIPGRPCGVDT